MSTLIQVDKERLIKEYNSANPAGRTLLEKVIGKDFFSIDIINRVISFETACIEIGNNPNDEKFITGEEDDIAYQKLKVIAKALRAGVILDFGNENQKKWAPWFRYDKASSGFRFSGACYDVAGAGALGGSRLCVDTDVIAAYFGGQYFIELWNKLLN